MAFVRIAAFLYLIWYIFVLVRLHYLVGFYFRSYVVLFSLSLSIPFVPVVFIPYFYHVLLCLASVLAYVCTFSGFLRFFYVPGYCGPYWVLLCGFRHTELKTALEAQSNHQYHITTTARWMHILTTTANIQKDFLICLTLRPSAKGKTSSFRLLLISFRVFCFHFHLCVWINLNEHTAHQFQFIHTNSVMCDVVLICEKKNHLPQGLRPRKQ